jgi:hypothetical protein
MAHKKISHKAPPGVVETHAGIMEAYMWPRRPTFEPWQLTKSIHDGLTLSNTGHPEALKACSRAVEPHSKAVDAYSI